MAKTAEILKILRTITERGQTTVPAAIRKMAALGKRDRSCFAGSPTATVVIATKEPRADDGDPVIGRCLAFLAHDMAIEPARIRPVPRSMVSRGKALVKGVRVDLNAPIPSDAPGPAAIRKVELASRSVGDPFVDMNGGTEAFGFGRAGDTPRVACDGLDGLGAAGPAYTMSVRIIAN